MTIAEGINKPYFDNKGQIWVKRGSDKRRVDSREELKRIFQRNDSIYADEVPVKGTSVALVDTEHFAIFYERLTGEPLTESVLSIAQIMHNQNLLQNGQLNLAGLLLFSRNPQQFKPTFIIKAICFVGNERAGTEYRDSLDLTGTIRQLYAQAIQFLKRNLHAAQSKQGFNSLGELEIPTSTLEELLVNALLHRDYFISAPIRLFVFDNRIEILSPGKLPNHLTVENIQNGASIIRNPILTSFATRDELPYRGIGSGILRALKAYPAVTFDNNEDIELFTVIIQRPH
ncbi:MAG: ATP-dependent DNA helicase RecG [Hymenobacter sp.]|nr:MAG: ATP-dependent DNA helicase RecG [Hymenobacter sp.]